MRKKIPWRTAGILAVSAGSTVRFFDLGTDRERASIDVPPGVGELKLEEKHQTLYVLGWTDIVAIGPTLAVKWWARQVAVDGIVFAAANSEIVRVSAEMDPPGGWVAVSLDAATGVEISREPARDGRFSPG